MEQKDSAERILKQIPYEIVYSVRKTLAVQVKADGSVVVRAPKRMAKYKIEAFLKEKQDWIHTHREKALAAAEQKAANRLTEAERKAAVKRAAQMLAEKTAHFAKEMGVTYGRITIREQKTRWGSCSSAGNLNYNWKLVLMPERVMDYERGYLNAVVKEPERTGDGTLWFPEENYFKAYYQPFFELFADEQPGELYGSSGGFELELTLPWTEEGKRGFRHLQIGTDQVTIALMREGKYDQILKRMENVLDLSKECRFCGEDGIWVGAE